MIKGLAITPPAVGRISIGRVVEKNGKRLPEKDDQFTLTTQVQNREGWILHPMDEALRQSAPGSKLRSIPVRMLFDDPALNLRAEYSLFDRSSGRPLCVGNGETCQRLGVDGVEVLSCPSPSLCPFAGAGSGTPQCKPYGRLHVQVDGPEAVGFGADVLDTFVFRTTGFNSIRTLAARLAYYQALSGDLLSCLPLQLKLRGKSTTQSHRTPIFYVDLTLREGLSVEQALAQAQAVHQARLDAGFYQQALDAAARAGFANAVFETSPDDVAEVLEEFYPLEGEEAGVETSANPPSALSPGQHPQGSGANLLRTKLAQRVSVARKGGEVQP